MALLGREHGRRELRAGLLRVRRRRLLSAVRQIGASVSVALFGTSATFAARLRARPELEALGYDASDVRFAEFGPAMDAAVQEIIRTSSADAFGDLLRLATLLFVLGLLIGLPLIRRRHPQT